MKEPKRFFGSWRRVSNWKVSVMQAVMNFRNGIEWLGADRLAKAVVENASFHVARKGAPKMKYTVVSDMEVQALVDNELDTEEKNRVLTALRLNPVLKARYEQLVMQKQMICTVWNEEEQSRLH